MARLDSLSPLAALILLLPSVRGLPLQDGDEPPAFPPGIASPHESDMSMPRGVHVCEPGAYEGFTLIAPLNSRSTHLVDMDGEIAHTWVTGTSPGSAYLLDDGTLLRCGRIDDDPHFRGGGIGGRIERLAPDGSALWSYDLKSEDVTQHHDIEPLPNGNVLAIHWERVSAEEAIQRGRDPRTVGGPGLWPDAVVELRPIPPNDAEVVWEWHSWDHLVQDFDLELPNFGAIAAHPGRIDVNGDHRDTPPLTPEQLAQQEELEEAMEALGYLGGDDEDVDTEVDEDFQRDGDWLHTNAVDYDEASDLIVLSTPHFCEVWILDHSTTTAEARTSRGGRYGHGGDLLWRWGNPRMHGAGTEADQRLFYQHDPRFVRGTDGELRLTLFNNGGRRPDGNYSTVEELVLPFDPVTGFTNEPGQPCPPSEPVWTYEDRDGFFSAFISGAQRLSNGNTLVCSGVSGHVFEVTPDGRVVWDYFNGLGGDVPPPDHAGKAPTHALFRATRLAWDHPGVRAVLGSSGSDSGHRESTR